MIKINLIQAAKPARKRSFRPRIQGSGDTFQNLMVIGIVLLGSLLIGWRWVSLAREGSELRGRIQTAEKEKKRLEEIIQKADLFKARKELLNRKISLITALKKSQSGPVHLLDQISSNLPDCLWLESMVETIGRSNESPLNPLPRGFSPAVGDGIDFNPCPLRQGAHLDGRTGRRRGPEETSINTIHFLERAEVNEVDGGLDHMDREATRRFQNGHQVFHHPFGLFPDGDSSRNLPAGRIEGDLSRCEHKIAGTDCLRIRPDRCRSLIGFNRSIFLRFHLSSLFDTGGNSLSAK